MMDEEELLAMASARVLMIETPADRIDLPPPPPAAVIEAPAMWHPADMEQADRVALGPSEEERDVAAVYAMWLGGTLVHMNLTESRPSEPQEPRRRRDDEEDEQ